MFLAEKHEIFAEPASLLCPNKDCTFTQTDTLAHAFIEHMTKSLNDQSDGRWSHAR